MPVRPLKTQHYSAVKSIYREAFKRNGYTDKDLGDTWRKRLGASCGYFNGHGDLLGFGLAIDRDRWRKNYIHFLAVYKKYRGCGYGSKILRNILKSLPNAYLWPEGDTDKETDALKGWYGAHGFRKSAKNFCVVHPYNTRSKSKPRPV